MGVNIVGTVSVLSRVSLSNNKESRYKYYTRIRFKMRVVDVILDAVVDTGSSVTIISMRDVIRNIRQNYKNDYKEVADRVTKLCNADLSSINSSYGASQTVNSASGHAMEMIPVLVENFRLTNEITLDKLKIYVSKDMEKSVLGMDILNNFGGSWNWQRGNKLAEFTFVDWEKRLEEIKKSCTTYNTKAKGEARGYIDPDFILLVENGESENNKSGVPAHKSKLLKAVSRICVKNKTIGYRLMDSNGRLKDFTLKQTIELVDQKKVSNMTLCKSGNRRYLRGNGCKLTDLPIINNTSR